LLWGIGSEPAQAMHTSLTLQLKRPGMTPDRDQAAGEMNLAALRENRQCDSYWQTRKPA